MRSLCLTDMIRFTLSFTHFFFIVNKFINSGRLKIEYCYNTISEIIKGEKPSTFVCTCEQNIGLKD